MTVNVGVIGVGMIGKDHIRRLTTVLAGAEVTAVTDVNLDEAKKVAQVIAGAPVLSTGQELISDEAVDAVLVCSWGHPRGVRAGRDRRRQAGVLREAPGDYAGGLPAASSTPRSLGRRLVQVGYMRRYDPAYRALKAVVDSGDIGAPLMMHCDHRNPGVPGHYTREMAITDTAVHEIDMVRWLFGEEIVGATVLSRARTGSAASCEDPLLLLLEMQGRAHRRRDRVNIRYGYDIRGEVVGETGTAALGESSPSPCGRTVGSPAGCPRTGGSASSPPTTSSSRSGSTASGTAAPRAELLGRLRGRGGLRRRRRGPAVSGDRATSN